MIPVIIPYKYTRVIVCVIVCIEELDFFWEYISTQHLVLSKDFRIKPIGIQCNLTKAIQSKLTRHSLC